MTTFRLAARRGLITALIAAPLGLSAPVAASATTIAEAGFGIDWSYRIGDTSDSAQLGGVSSLPLTSTTADVLDFDDNVDGTGTVKLRADLATGELGASASVQNPARVNELGNTSIRMEDTLLIDLSSFGSGDSVTFNFATSIEGTLGYGTDEDDFLETSSVEYGFSLRGAAGGGLTFSPLRIGVTYGIDDSGLTGSGSLDLTDARVTQDTDPFPQGDFTSMGKTDFTGSFDLTGGQSYSFEFSTYLNLDQQADFLGTSTFDLSGPVAIGSASGTFLSSSTTVIPVPAALPLLAAGLGAMALMSRRRRRAA